MHQFHVLYPALHSGVYLHDQNIEMNCFKSCQKNVWLSYFMQFLTILLLALIKPESCRHWCAWYAVSIKIWKPQWHGEFCPISCSLIFFFSWNYLTDKGCIYKNWTALPKLILPGLFVWMSFRSRVFQKVENRTLHLCFLVKYWCMWFFFPSGNLVEFKQYLSHQCIPCVYAKTKN